MGYTEHMSSSMGNITIEGVFFPHRHIDPLAKLWATVRKEARKKHKVDIVASFAYDDVKNIVSCNFYLNYSFIEFSSTSKEIYQQNFEDNFLKIANGFEALIDIFIEDDAFNEYIELSKKAETEKSITRDDFAHIFNAFLEDLGLKQM